MGGGISVKTSVPSSYSLGRIDHGLRVLQRTPGAPSWFSLLHLSAVLNEYLGIAAYWVLGWR